MEYKKINVLGLGPGDLNYTLPITLKIIEKSDAIIGGRRHIESLGKYAEGKEYCYITADLNAVLNYINQNRNKEISLILSGDTGFYSMLTFMRKNYSEDELNVVPGISSLQYMFSKISDYWYDALVTSAHGKTVDYVAKMKEYDKIGLLTDNNNTPQAISKVLTENGFGDVVVYVGENLSYNNEKISKYLAKKLKDEERKFDMNVVVLKK